jgi:hypothetical protein
MSKGFSKQESRRVRAAIFDSWKAALLRGADVETPFGVLCQVPEVSELDPGYPQIKTVALLAPRVAANPDLRKVLDAKSLAMWKRSKKYEPKKAQAYRERKKAEAYERYLAGNFRLPRTKSVVRQIQKMKKENRLRGMPWPPRKVR